MTPQGTSAAHDVVFGARRPVSGVVARLPEVPVAVSTDTWELAVPPHLPRGPDLGAIAPHRRELHWPRSLLGIDWLGTLEHEPPQAFVVGRALHGAWIADVRSNADSGEIELAIGWREDRVDPLGLSIYARSHKDGLPLLARQLRVSDLPPRGDLPELDPRRRPWRERVLWLSLPRGPRRTEWGVQLLDAGGQLLDERPVVPRVERVEISMRVDGGAASSVVIGDREPIPSASDHDDAVDQALALEGEARRAAAARRMSTTGALKDYLRWRLSCRDGELLLLDSYLLDATTAQTTLEFLATLDRPIRALTAKWNAEAAVEAQAAGVVVRRLPQGVRDLHDRVWLFGESGLLVGGPSTCSCSPKAWSIQPRRRRSCRLVTPPHGANGSRPGGAEPAADPPLGRRWSRVLFIRVP